MVLCQRRKSDLQNAMQNVELGVGKMLIVMWKPYESVIVLELFIQSSFMCSPLNSVLVMLLILILLIIK